MSKLHLACLSFFTFLLLIFPANIAFAGGGGVYSTTTGTDDPHWNIVRTYFDPNLYSCKGMLVSLNFESPKDGDKISGSNGDNSSTIIDEASYETVDGKQYLRCSIYVKVYSSTLESNRLLTINYKNTSVDGSRTIAISFSPGLNHENLSLLPWEEASSGHQPTPAPIQTTYPTPRENINDNPGISVLPTPSGSDQKIEELNQKVENLQNQFDKSKKIQNDLEKRINELVDLIKNLFHFFK